MSLKRRLVKAIKILSKRFGKFSKKYITAINKPINWLLRTLFITRRRRESANAGFVLPTVAMVALVVLLLTTAILFRSFDRAKNASNVRVNQVVLNAAIPAIDRARAKIEALLQDPTLPRGTPSDGAIYDAIKKDKYRLGDETRLKLAFDINGDNSIQTNTTSLESDETLKTAWKYAVDTDNNGKKDTFTLYGIYFRSPTRSPTSGEFNRKRNPLEARTPPMDNDSTSEQCRNAAGFSTLVGNSSWYKLQSGNLGKGFFVYTVNVPINKQTYDNLPTADQSKFEDYKGNKGFAALEFQQDRSRIPLPNNAVWYENDLEIKLGATELSLNGRIHTNGNLLVQVTNSNGEIKLRQVSSKTSCFYNQENGQISLGGNVGIGNISQTSDQGSATVDLYKGFNTNPDETKLLNSTNKSTNSGGGSLIGFNDAAYSQRIAQMKTDGLGFCTTCQSATGGSALKSAVAASSYPNDVKNNVAAKVSPTDDATTAKSILADEIEIYLRNRTRRVPFTEVSDPTGSGATSGYTTITASLEPQATWREPLNASNQFTGATTVSLKTDQLNATYPPDQQKRGTQDSLGDRLFVGNNLPAMWLQNGKYVGSDANQLITNNNTAVNWTTAPITGGNQQRWRNTQIQAITDLGISDRNGFWEQKAAENPANDLDSVGGVRIVTGAGIYVDDPDVDGTTTGAFYDRPTNSFLLNPPDPTPADSNDIPVWPDTMPMSSPAAPTKKGDLLMRATAVYHYKKDYGTDQEPIACVSSYYDPSDQTTAKNKLNLDVGYGVDATNGKSNNGIVYTYPGRSTFGTNQARLLRQAKLKFPNGRWANEPLKNALAKISGTSVPSTGLQLADYSAIDTALCAISILNPLTSFATALTDMPAHGAIKEAAFLDAREAKQISASSTSTAYDLKLEERQPLETRVTDIDLASLGSTAITGNEYLLPLSGIIYASREDALRDASDTTTQSELLSTTDFKLHPTRRPNGIRLINGETLARKPSTNQNAYNAKEKGLIMVSNLPAYIKGKFNLHRINTTTTNEIEEFTELVDDSTASTSNFYTRSTANTNFACRPGRTGCGSGTDYWRPATIITDAMTLLSSTFKDGVRSEGDYDLNNNSGIPVELTDVGRTARLNNGFWENNFVTSANWWQLSGTDQNFPQTTLGSYSVNGVTPIQRRINSHPMYVMEICRKLPVSECQPSDWVVGFDSNGNNDLDDPVLLDLNGNGVTTDPGESLIEKDIKVYHLGKAIATAAGSSTTTALANWDTAFTTSPYNKSIRGRLGAGDTGDKLTLVATDRRYPRRVAFARDNTGQLIRVSTSPDIYKPMGIGCAVDITGTGYSNNGCTYAATATELTNYGKKGNNALWFRTVTAADPTVSCVISSTNNCTNNQPLFYYPPSSLSGQPRLVPVLQIHDAKNTSPSSIRTDGSTDSAETYRNKWLQIANANSVSTDAAFNTTFNAVFVVANSPSRPDEESAGLPNLVRFLEAWTTGTSSTSSSRTAKISGSFIQLQRSAYATGPFTPLYKNRQSTSVSTLGNLSLFDYLLDDYPTSNNKGTSPFYEAPARKWGFDIGLLSEQPDLFAQRFTLPPTGRPNEFFREVGRDDPWVKTLLCAGQASNQTGIADTANPTVTYSAAVPNEYRPSDCPSSIPSDSAS